MGRQQLWEWISSITIQKKSYEGLKMLIFCQCVYEYFNRLYINLY